MRITTSLLASLLLLTVARPPLDAQRPDSAMVGSWIGRGQITVPWTVQRELVVRIRIRDDGSVSGAIGDARLLDAHLVAESRLARVLHQARQFVIEGRLPEPVIRAEALQRDRVRLSLDWTRGTLTGALQTSGSYASSSADGMLTATVLLSRDDSGVIALSRAPAQVHPSANRSLTPRAPTGGRATSPPLGEDRP